MATGSSSLRRLDWLKSRRGKWAAVISGIVIAYTLFGFLVVPWLMESQLVDTFAATGCTTVVEETNANPFTLSGAIEGFQLICDGDEPSLSFDRLLVDLDVSSVWRLMFVVSKVVLQAPSVNVVRGPEGRVVLLDRLGPLLEDESDEEGEGEDTQPYRFVVEELDVSGGSLLLRDEVPEPDFETLLADLGFRMSGLTNVPEQAAGAHRLDASSEVDEAVQWTGRLSLDPLVATGSVSVTSLKLSKYHPYVGGLGALEFPQGTADALVGYELDVTPSLIRVALRDGSVRTSSVTVAVESHELLHVEDFRLDGLDAEAVLEGSNLEAAASLSTLAVRGGWVDVQLDAQLRPLGFRKGWTSTSTRSLPSTRTSTRSAPSNAAAPAGGGSSIPMTVGRVDVRDFDVRFAHQVATGAVEVLLRNLRLQLGRVTFPFTAGSTVAVAAGWDMPPDGRVEIRGGLDPANISGTADLDIQSLGLTPFQPYVAQRARAELSRGALSVEGRATYDGTFRFEGDVEVSDLTLMEATSRGPPLVAWSKLQASAVQVNPELFRVERVDLLSPRARVEIDPDGRINLVEVFQPPDSGVKRPERAAAVDSGAGPARSAGPTPPRAGGMDVRIGRVTVRDATLGLSDQSVTPRFRTTMGQLSGRVDGLTTARAGRGRVALDGKVDRYASVNVEGEVQPFDLSQPSSIRLRFRNVPLASFTPYAAKFAGYTIRKGKLNVDLEYTLEGLRIDGDNTVRVDQLTLGDRVESPDAVKLPLRLGIALLKDRNGVIDLDLPVSGSLDDPKFSVGKIVWKAVVNTLKKAVLAPFAAIGGLFSSSGEKAAVPFVVGTSTTSPDAAEDMLRLEEQLFDRPALVVEIEGQWDPEADRSALAQSDLIRVLNQLSVREDFPARDLPELELAPDEMLVIEAHRRAFGGAAPTSTRTMSLAAFENRVLRPWSPPPEKKEKNADAQNGPPKPYYLSEPAPRLERELWRRIEVPPIRLRDLAATRAQAVQDVLMSRDRLGSERVFLLEPSAGKKPAVRLRLDAR
ncbi:MAG: DUF748 domain-containing protein [Myxococcota bacterium]